MTIFFEMAETRHSEPQTMKLNILSDENNALTLFPNTKYTYNSDVPNYPGIISSSIEREVILPSAEVTASAKGLLEISSTLSEALLAHRRVTQRMICEYMRVCVSE